MAIDSPVQRDGDQGFLGFASRLNPLTLPAGMLQDSVNMRLERGTAQTRKGAKRLADAISTADEPLTLSFDLAADKAITSITFTSGASCSTDGFLTSIITVNSVPDTKIAVSLESQRWIVSFGEIPLSTQDPWSATPS